MFHLSGFAQKPINDNCVNAIELPSSKEFCSTNQQYTTEGASSSYQNSGNDVWFKFTPRNAYDLYVTVYGAGNGATLQSPAIRMFTDCTFNTALIGSSNSVNNVTTLYEGGLKIGRTYYINVTGSNTGTFKLCFQNQNAIVKPGQDCSTARFLCSMETIRESNISGAGNNPDEGAGTCMENVDPHDGTHPNTETNSTWFKWTAANNGTLVFTITPTVNTDDLDWVLFDMGLSDNCANKIAIRCADGSGVKNHLPPSEKGCPSEPGYYKTGLDFNVTDINERIGCGMGQDGKVKYIDMQKDHNYALMINNPYSQGNGFILDFTDQLGKAGTGSFVGPQAIIDFQENNRCTLSQSYTVRSLSTDAVKLNWDFGDGADTPPVSGPGPYTITYSTPGTKTIVLEARGDNICYTLATKTFDVGPKPILPVISSNEPNFCIKDTIKLVTPQLDNALYHWTGPNNYNSNERAIIIPVNDFSVAGTYKLTTEIFGCFSDEATITIPPILKNPTAAFSVDPNPPAKLSAPVTASFFNNSQDADTYLWDFGDGSTSSDINPKHEYTTVGEYNVTLTAYKSTVCSASVMKGKFVIRAENTLFIPNTFTPNNDNINDEFVVTITNLKTYRIQIFNRYGMALFLANDIFDNWKGIYKNEPLPTATYYYVIDAVGLNGSVIKKSGSITLVK